MSDNRAVTGKEYNALLDYIRCVSNIQVGPGLEKRTMAAGVFISLMKHPLDLFHQSPSGGTPGGDGTLDGNVARVFPAQITVVNTGGDNYWAYDFEEMKKVGPGYDSEYLGGDVWDHIGVVGTAYNFCENTNGNMGVQGNGVDVENLPDGFEIQPCPEGSIIVMYQIRYGVGYEYWFEYQNGIDGACAE